MTEASPEIKLVLLERKRETLFARINRLYNITRNISSYESNSRTNENFMAESEDIDDVRKRFEIVVDQINEIKLTLKPDSTPDYAGLESFEDLYTRVKRTRNKINSAAITLLSRSNNQGGSKDVVTKINLPPLVIPSFDGKFENWPVFYESFKSNVHDNDQLSDSQRMQYLVGKLTHNALKVLAGVVPTGDTYPSVWDSLVGKYQDKRALGTHYLNNILDINSCSHNANSLDSFVETFSASISALKQLNLPDLSDFIILHCAIRKIDCQTAQYFEMSVRNTEIPTSRDLIKFVQEQVRILERSNSTTSYSRNVSHKPVAKATTSREPRATHTYKALVASESVATPPGGASATRATSATCATPSSISRLSHCAYCNDNRHTMLVNCEKFNNLPSSKARFEIIKSKGGCVCCLDLSHTFSSCISKSNCEFCSKRHHTLLHFNNRNIKTHTHAATIVDYDGSSLLSPLAPQSRDAPTLCPAPSPAPALEPLACRAENTGDSGVLQTREVHKDINVVSPPPHDSAVLLSAEAKSSSIVLLSTAQVYAQPKGGTGIKKIVRCLIDNGSQNNLITTDCCRNLNLSIIPLSNSYVKGIGSTSRPIIGYVYFDIQSRVYPVQKYTIHALVVECITDQLPTQLIEWDSNLSHLNGLPLADLSWNIPGEIDVVLGAQLFPYIYSGKRVDSDSGAPPALSTTFGYVLMGDYPRNDAVPSASFTALSLNEMVQRFWELEELPQTRFLSPDETECENIFTSSVTRSDTGRYITSLPFSKDPSELGNSHAVAYRRFMSLERKLRQSPSLRENYNKVIQEYIDNGYLRQLNESDITDTGYYIPHHAVVRPDKPLPRIVLDASAKTHTGLSLNDVLHLGPNLQSDLFLLLLQFRLFPVAMNADIKHMYLCIGVSEDQHKYLRILFRFSENDLVRTFQFNRVPFGLKSSPYLAMRTVRQLATDMSPHYPEAAKIAETSLYMDDLVYSAPDEFTAKQLCQDLIKMFKSGEFELVKWSSNSPELMNSLPDSHRKILDFDADNIYAKVLGLSWQPKNDQFSFTSTPITEKCTKRNILSIVARLFDVLGLVAPVILYAKLLIKELWLTDCGWDDPAPDQIMKRFTVLALEFPLLDSLRIPRHVGVEVDNVVRLVAFCDASMNGYGSVVYVHCTGQSGIKVRLLCAKSKVSPTKIVTLARLELCAAVLMAKLVKTVRDTYASRISIEEIYAFSDSTIALSWIHSSPHRWSVFVSNRVAQCQENLSPQHFYHVETGMNASDCLSRGMLPSQLLSHELWWNGPTWLRSSPKDWPIKPFSPTTCGELPEHRATVLTVTSQTTQPLLCELAQRTSSWDKLLRIIRYILKFTRPKTCDITKINPVQGLLAAEQVMVRAVQSVYFSQDIELIKSNRLPSKKLHSLSVFLDEVGILRVGGRLSKSDLPFDAKYPVLLPKRDHVVDLIIMHYHVSNCHTGSGLLMSIIRQRFWILDARTVIRSKVRKCNSCFRLNPTHPTPMMADLPAYRVSEAKAFAHTGVDYAGPLRVTLARRRGQHSQKAYICLFVCLVTKAIHVELVSDLTSDGFLAAFKRFISRRGPVSCLYSDNATNFVGAKAQLDELYSFLLSSSFKSSFAKEMETYRVEWKMIPPRAPHFGSMWESNIKSLKTHLFRVIGSQLLTYEELQTVLVQVECILNSRPLNVVSSDPHPEVLTPAHFLMSTPLKYLPAAELSETKYINLTQRKKLLDAMVQSFWKKWRLEYLHTLQIKQKWATPAKPVTIGTVVLVGQDDSPPLSWPLGVITEVYPGTDNVIRVAMVKTQSGNYKRPVVKLYPIPTQ